MSATEVMALSPDGRRLAWAGSLGPSEEPSRVGVYDAPVGSQEALFRTRAINWRDLAYSPDGVLLVALGDASQPAAAWMGSTPVFSWLEAGGNQAVISLDGLTLATSQAVVFLKDRRLIPLKVPPPVQTPWGVAFSPAGDVLVSQTLEGGLYFWRTADGTLLASRGVPPGRARIAFSPDGAWFTVLGDDFIIRWGLP
jgi:WD40 repeat protein